VNNEDHQIDEINSNLVISMVSDDDIVESIDNKTKK